MLCIVMLDCLMEVLCALSDVSGEGCCGLLKGIEPPALSHGTANQFTSLAGVGLRLSSQGARQVLIMKLSN